jgi:hypothetical protein
LDQPADVVGEELVINHPSSKFVPFIYSPAIDGYPPFGHLILAGLEIRDDLLGDFC